MTLKLGAVCTTLALLASACSTSSSGPSESETLVIAKSDEATSLDPHIHDGWFSVRVQSAAYEGLVDMRWDPDLKELVIDPLLATDWEISQDRMTYTFNLRQGVQFHDGTEFTSEDVRATFERNSKIGSRPSYQVEAIESIETPDDHTVVLHLSEPWTPFMMALARAYIMSGDAIQEHYGDDQAQAYFNEEMVGTGPYQLEEFTRDKITRMSTFPDYWRGWKGQHFENVVLRHVPEGATQSLLVESGEVDVALQVPVDDLEKMSDEPGVVVESKPTDWALQFTMKLKGPLQDKNVRKALQYAFPYESFINDIMKGHGTKLDGGPITPGVPGYSPQKVTTYEHDLEKAREFLAKSEYPNGGFKLLIWTFAPYPYQEDAALMWADELKTMNIDLKVHAEASNAIYGQHWSDFDAAPNIYGFLNSTFIPDPDAYLRRWYGKIGIGGLNSSFYRNERVNEILETARLMPNGPERDRMYSEMAEIVTEDAIHLNIMRVHNIKVYRESVGGYVYNPHDSIREFRYYDMYRKGS